MEDIMDFLHHHQQHRNDSICKWIVQSASHMIFVFDDMLCYEQQDQTASASRKTLPM